MLFPSARFTRALVLPLVLVTALGALAACSKTKSAQKDSANELVILLELHLDEGGGRPAAAPQAVAKRPEPGQPPETGAPSEEARVPGRARDPLENIPVLTHKTNEEYLAIRLFEYPDTMPPVEEETFIRKTLLLAREEEQVRPLESFRNKRLVLAGRGASISEFEAVQNENLQFKFKRTSEAVAMVTPYEPPPELEREGPDDDRPIARRMVFHSKGLAVNYIENEVEVTPPRWPTPPQTPVSKGPEAKIVFSRTERDHLKLPKGTDRLDLIFGNETINYDRFHSDTR